MGVDSLNLLTLVNWHNGSRCDGPTDNLIKSLMPMSQSTHLPCG